MDELPPLVKWAQDSPPLPDPYGWFDIRGEAADGFTADQMRDQYRIAPGTLRRWAAEGKVKKRGRDGHGRQLYDVAEARGMREVIA